MLYYEYGLAFSTFQFLPNLKKRVVAKMLGMSVSDTEISGHN